MRMECIDLGLPSGTKWANMNLGANTPEDPGLYFTWGATDGKADGSDNEFYEANYALTQAAKIGTNLPLEHDAAHVLLGGDWCIPTKEDFVELCTYCTREWTTRDRIKGCVFTSKLNGNKVFFPAAGYYNCSSLYQRGYLGSYWSRSHYSDTNNAYLLLFISGGGASPLGYHHYRYCGLPIRAVRHS